VKLKVILSFFFFHKMTEKADFPYVIKLISRINFSRWEETSIQGKYTGSLPKEFKENNSS